MSSGIVVVSIGEDRRQLLWNCLASIKRYAGDLGLFVITDTPLKENMLLVRPRILQKSRFYKTQIHRFSPFDITLFIDDDTVIHRALPDLSSVLGDSDIKMCLTLDWTTILSVCTDTKTRWALEPEKRITLKECHHDTPFFNSGVILFKKTEKSKTLLDTWHNEWLRFQHIDQLALSRAIHKTGIVPQTLDTQLWNCRTDWYNKDIQNPYIFHFSVKRDEDWYHTTHAKPATPSDTYLKFKKAVTMGLCTRDNYLTISRLIISRRPCKLLVFGCGADSEFWVDLNCGGKTLFVENNEYWYKHAQQAGISVFYYAYPTRMGISEELPDIPDELKDDWDIIFINSPEGWTYESPGREVPIYWASKFKDATIILHDYIRIWEYNCYMKYLGTPEFVSNLYETNELAFWRLKEKDRELLLI